VLFPAPSHAGRTVPLARLVALLLAVSAYAAPSLALAAEAPVAIEQAAPALDEHPLRYDLRVDLPVTAIAIAAWVGTEIAVPWIAPRHCIDCDRDPNNIDTLNSVDAAARAALRVSNETAADRASSVFAFALVPLAALGLDALAAGHDHALRGWPVDTLVIAEAAALAADLNQLVKFNVGRQRPYAHALAPSPDGASNRDDNLSFYSGHTSLVFSLAVASGTVATLRRYRLAPIVWAAGLALAATTGYLRIAADRHYLSDVLVGGAAGSLVGFAVPYLFHRARGPHGSVALAPAPGGALLAYGGSF
jgi:membrane-associated phospholipid phosphatase